MICSNKKTLEGGGGGELNRLKRFQGRLRDFSSARTYYQKSTTKRSAAQQLHKRVKPTRNDSRETSAPTWTFAQTKKLAG